MSKTYRNRSMARRWATRSEAFRCRHCGMFVGPILYGGSHRNHCPYCLYSRHVDGKVPGDRASTCGGSMAPIGVFSRPKGEHVVVHRCLSCGFERHNRIAADDDFALVLRLPEVPTRGPRRLVMARQASNGGPAPRAGDAGLGHEDPTLQTGAKREVPA